MIRLALIVMLIAQDRPLDGLVAAERAFARSAVESTTQQAFLAALAEDAIMFRDGPRPGRALMLERPYPPESLLKWAPMLADIAQSGELGYTTGPFESGRRGEAPRAKGYFVSVWRKDPGGKWKLLVDLGIGAPTALPVDSASRVLRAAPRVEAAASGGGGTADDLLAADRRFAQLASTGGPAEAFGQTLADSARVYRNTHEPAVGRSKALTLVRGVAARWEPTLGKVAASGDLGYTIGRYEAGSERGGYLRIWRKTQYGWKIVLDITAPTPA
jgi:ketosteroid isomerase-like protein